MGLITKMRDLERYTRSGDPDFTDALARRWDGLPDIVKTPGQVLGRHAVGCEGTHGVFPKCNLACTPCYHSRDANRVRIDGQHTVREVRGQMKLLRKKRGPYAHAQLIGGEVTLLPPEDHAETIEAMRENGREPMSMTHGDFDYDYLEELALGADGKKRFDKLSFAAHFDMFMFGRRGIERPADEMALSPYRKRFVEMFKRLRKEHGVRSFLAHNMTVTPRNLDQIADVIRDTRGFGFGMYSFQPAAFLGDDRRWHEKYRDATPDAVWEEIEKGAGTALDFHVFENGDVRCNRTAYGYYVGDSWYPWLDGDDPQDLVVREAYFTRVGHIMFGGTPAPLLIAQVLRVLIRQPSTVSIAFRWVGRSVRRVGLRQLVANRGVRPTTFVMHQFMDADVVAPAWDLMKRGESSEDPTIKATQERLAACHYAMAHPENDELVPACVQHAVLDPVENMELRKLLPIIDVRTRATAAK